MFAFQPATAAAARTRHNEGAAGEEIENFMPPPTGNTFKRVTSRPDFALGCCAYLQRNSDFKTKHGTAHGFIRRTAITDFTGSSCVHF
jgi:hypothetical protein